MQALSPALRFCYARNRSCCAVDKLLYLINTYTLLKSYDKSCLWIRQSWKSSVLTGFFIDFKEYGIKALRFFEDLNYFSLLRCICYPTESLHQLQGLPPRMQKKKRNGYLASEIWIWIWLRVFLDTSISCCRRYSNLSRYQLAIISISSKELMKKLARKIMEMVATRRGASAICFTLFMIMCALNSISQKRRFLCQLLFF